MICVIMNQISMPEQTNGTERWSGELNRNELTRLMVSICTPKDKVSQIGPSVERRYRCRMSCQASRPLSRQAARPDRRSTLAASTSDCVTANKSMDRSRLVLSRGCLSFLHSALQQRLDCGESGPGGVAVRFSRLTRPV